MTDQDWKVAFEAANPGLLAHMEDHGHIDVAGCEYCATRPLMALIHDRWRNGSDAERALIWSLQDGYGEPGYTPPQGYDWSGIRDSSNAATRAMYDALVALAGPTSFEIVEGHGPDGERLFRVVEYNGSVCRGGRGSFFKRPDAEAWIEEHKEGAR